MNYAEAVFQPRVTAAGLRLLPLTVGHALLLQRLGSPFTPGNSAEPGAGDCALLVLVCSRPWKRAAKLLESRWSKPLLWWRWLRGIWKLPPLRSLLFAYVSDAWTGPAVWISRQGGEQDGDPLRVVINTLCSRIGMEYGKALDVPLKQALWEVCGYWAQEGALTFQSPEERAAIAEARSMAQ